MDIHITYETLFDLLRKERSLEELQELDKQFWYYVIDYLKERQAFFDSTSAIEQEKMRLQLSNIKRILKEIYERREQKILQLALNVIRTDNVGFVDTRNMLFEERLLFDETVQLLKKYKTGILEQVFLHELPTIAVAEHGVEQDSIDKEAAFQDTYSSKNSSFLENTEDASFGQSATTVSAPIEEHVAVTAQSTQTKSGTLLVKFVTPVPKFLGKDKEVFGPYDAGTITSLPEHIAAILLKKEKVEKVMAE